MICLSILNTITVEINGMNYRIRIPDGKYDSVYSSWENGKYKYDEVNLINDLHAAFLSRDRIAKFLFELTYFKCFNLVFSDNILNKYIYI